MSQKTCAICYGAYLCVFTLTAALSKVWKWDLGFPFALLAGGALLFGVSRFTSYDDRKRPPDQSVPETPEPTPGVNPSKATWLRRLDRWSPLLWALLTALPPLLFILLSADTVL